MSAPPSGTEVSMVSYPMSGSSARPSGSRRALRWPRNRAHHLQNAQHVRGVPLALHGGVLRGDAPPGVAHRVVPRRGLRPSPWKLVGALAPALDAAEPSGRTSSRAWKDLEAVSRRHRARSVAPARGRRRAGPRRVVRDASEADVGSPRESRARTRETPREPRRHLRAPTRGTHLAAPAHREPAGACVQTRGADSSEERRRMSNLFPKSADKVDDAFSLFGPRRAALQTARHAAPPPRAARV